MSVAGMSPEDLKKQFDEVAKSLWAARVKLNRLYSQLSRNDDKRALQGILINLTWACENCSVIGQHQVGEALDDRMGAGITPS